jgi:hypothetical protein
MKVIGDSSATRSLSDLGLIYSAIAPCVALSPASMQSSAIAPCVAWSAHFWCSTSSVTAPCVTLPPTSLSSCIHAVGRWRESGPPPPRKLSPDSSFHGTTNASNSENSVLALAPCSRRSPESDRLLGEGVSLRLRLTGCKHQIHDRSRCSKSKSERGGGALLEQKDGIRDSVLSVSQHQSAPDAICRACRACRRNIIVQLSSLKNA